MALDFRQTNVKNIWVVEVLLAFEINDCAILKKRKRKRKHKKSIQEFTLFENILTFTYNDKKKDLLRK